MALSIVVYPGYYGLPSLDWRSLACISLSKFCRANVSIETDTRVIKIGTLNGFTAATRPALLTQTLASGPVEDTDFNSILTHIRRTGQDCDVSLDSGIAVRVAAGTSLVQEELAPAAEHAVWLDEIHMPDHLHNIMRAFVFPYSLFARPAICRLIEQRHSDLGIDASTLKARGTRAITHLSVLLGDSMYFGGKTPATLDAVAHSCLSLISNACPDHHPLKVTLSGHENLAKYVKRLDHELYRESMKQYGWEKHQKDKRAKQSWLYIEPQHRKLVKFGGIVGLGLVGAFAVHRILLPMLVRRLNSLLRQL